MRPGIRQSALDRLGPCVLATPLPCHCGRSRLGYVDEFWLLHRGPWHARSIMAPLDATNNPQSCNYQANTCWSSDLAAKPNSRTDTIMVPTHTSDIEQRPAVGTNAVHLPSEQPLCIPHLHLIIVHRRIAFGKQACNGFKPDMAQSELPTVCRSGEPLYRDSVGSW